MAFTKTNKKRTLKKMTLELVSLETDKFNIDELIEVLNKVTFELINVNLSSAKAIMGLNGVGQAPIGLVNRFYVNTEGRYVFDVAIFDKYINKVEALAEIEEQELMISARVFTNKEGKITKIIGLDLTPVSL